MSRGWYYKSGDWNVICDRCGHKYKASKLQREWTGLMVCSQCFETRHPQDFIRARQDRIVVPWTRPISDNPQQVTPDVMNSGPINDKPFN